MIQKLLSYLHRPFGTDPKQQLALRVRHSVSLTWQVVEGTLLIVSDSLIIVDLSSHTIESLQAYLLTQGLEIAYYDATLADRSALILIDGGADQDDSNGDHLYVYTSLLWAIMGAYGIELALARAAIQELPDQMALPTAREDWLDLLGTWYGVARKAAETDNDYSNRIIADVIKPKCNNIAIQDALATAWGINLDQVGITDAPMEEYLSPPFSEHTHHYCEFDLTLRPPFDTSQLWDMVPWLDAYRAAGTRLRRVITELHDQAPYIAAATLTGEITTIYPGP